MAVVDEVISSPGHRLPCSEFFSKKFFIKKAKEPSGLWFYMYVEYCPSCGEKVMEK
jgi:hypothetical protein